MNPPPGHWLPEVDDDGVKIGEVAISLLGPWWSGRVKGADKRLPPPFDTEQEARAAVRTGAAERAARLAREAAMPPGARFALAVRRQLRIGPRTHRLRDGERVCDEILRMITQESQYPSGTLDGEAIRAGAEARWQYERNFRSGRLHVFTNAWLGDPTPWNLIGLLADLLEQDVRNTATACGICARPVGTGTPTPATCPCRTCRRDPSRRQVRPRSVARDPRDAQATSGRRSSIAHALVSDDQEARNRR